MIHKTTRLLVLAVIGFSLMGLKCPQPDPKDPKHAATVQAIEEFQTATSAVDEDLAKSTVEELSDPMMLKLSKTIGVSDSLGQSPVGDPLLATSDIDALVQIVMMQAAAEAESDLRDVMEQMSEANKKKQAMRDHIAKMKDAATKVLSQLRDEYAQRTKDETFTFPDLFTYDENKSFAFGDAAGTSSAGAGSATEVMPSGSTSSATLDCGNSAALTVSLSVIDLMTNLTLASAQGSNFATTQFSVSARTGIALKASVHGQGGDLFAINPCVIRLIYTARKPVNTTIPQDKRRNLTTLSAQGLQQISDARKEIARLIQSQSPVMKTSLAALLIHALDQYQAEYQAVLSTADLNEIVEATKDKMESQNELGEMQQLRLQMYMDRYSKVLETLSNLMKKMSETSQGIVANLK